MGVRHPPILDTINMKKIMIWLFLLLQEFILITGRTISILAPVVPIQLARRVPSANSPTLILGDPAKSPSMVILPETQNSPNRRTINVR